MWSGFLFRSLFSCIDSSFFFHSLSSVIKKWVVIMRTWQCYVMMMMIITQLLIIQGKIFSSKDFLTWWWWWWWEKWEKFTSTLMLCVCITSSLYPSFRIKKPPTHTHSLTDTCILSLSLTLFLWAQLDYLMMKISLSWGNLYIIEAFFPKKGSSSRMWKNKKKNFFSLTHKGSC